MDIAGFLAVEFVQLAVTVAAVKTSVFGLTKTVDRHETSFVPRTEFDLAVKGFESSTRQTQAMVQALIYHDNRVDLKGVQAAADPNFIQICMDGVDGKGGLNRWEGRVPYLYLDSRRVEGIPAPRVTVGVGCALELAEALTLPFTVDGQPATRAAIAFDYAALSDAPFGLAADYYAPFTHCRLPDRAIDDLLQSRLNVFIPALHAIFPRFDLLPETVKAGCLDLIFSVGVGGLAAPHYPIFRAAVNRFDWGKAAEECACNAELQAYDSRNEARRQLFLAALA